MTVSPEEAKNRIAALLRERASYKQAGKDDRVAQVDEQLKIYKSLSEVRKSPPVGRTETPPGRQA